MLRFLFVFLFLINALLLKAQLDNSPFFDKIPLDSTLNRGLFLSVANLGFNKDNEYFNPIAEGYTLFGYQLNPEVVFVPSENIRLEAGAFFLKDFGNPVFNRIAPTYSVKLKKDSTSFIFGTIQGSLSHRLIEPLYHFELVTNNRIEDGMQVLVEKKKLFTDVWINWERMQYDFSPFQEELWGGVSSEFTLSEKKWKWSLPVQLLAKHKGGQLDSVEVPLITYFNGAIGFSAHYDRPIPENLHQGRLFEGFYRGIRFDNYMTVFSDRSFEKVFPIKNGYGAYLNLTVLTKFSDVMISYWHGENFHAFKGGYLYQSLSTKPKNPGFLLPRRDLIILRFMKDYQLLPNLFLSTRFEPFFDFYNSKVNFSMGLYINYRNDFLLTKIKER